MATSSDAPKKNNTLHIWGNERTMNMNHLILTNIVTSNYFKNDLLKLKTFHEIVDEIYNQVGLVIGVDLVLRDSFSPASR